MARTMSKYRHDWLSDESVAALLRDLGTLRDRRAAVDAVIAEIEAMIGPENITAGAGFPTPAADCVPPSRL